MSRAHTEEEWSRLSKPSQPPAAPSLREALDKWIPQHSSECAAQDQEADCICGTADVYRAALASSDPGSRSDGGLDVEVISVFADITNRLGGVPCLGHEDFAAGTFTFHRERECLSGSPSESEKQ